MSAATYIKITSWHTLARVDAAGWHTRCGRLIVDAAPVSDSLPMDERSCESCLRQTTHDADEQAKGWPAL